MNIPASSASITFLKQTNNSKSTINRSLTQAEKLAWFHNYFRPHFDEWIIGPIDRLVNSKDALIGFIFMSCAIDYLAGFWYGKNTSRNVKKTYTGFLKKYFSNKYNADDLYDSLRNGLVHMFTIKNKKFALTHNNQSSHLKNGNNSQIILNADDFRNDLNHAKEKYFTDVENNPQLLDNLINRYEVEGFLALSLVSTNP